MEENKVWKKILWAVDPLSEENKLQASAALAVQLLTEAGETPIEPIYLLNLSPLGIPISLPPEIVAQTCTTVQEKLDEIVSHIQLKTLLPVKVLAKPYRNQKEIADALIDYAKETGAELIVASTHARTGVQRWFTGSFVENLMLYSDVPLFIVNPHWKSVTDFRHVLFPTDFSDESFLAFAHVLNLVESLRGEITIFHQIAYVINPYVQATLTVYPLYKEAFEQDLAAKQKKANELASLAQKKGIRAHTYIDYHLLGSTAEVILSFAKKKHCIIAMTARSGRLTATLLGSTTRKVLRGAAHPVWVIHPQYLTKDLKQEQNAA